jgi:AraC-like DNA-binding protein
MAHAILVRTKGTAGGMIRRLHGDNAAWVDAARRRRVMMEVQMEISCGLQLQQQAVPEGKRRGNVMLITADRVIYAGLLGRPQTREFGSITLYVSLGSPFRIQVGDGAWEHVDMRVVQPGTPHQIASDDRMIGSLLIESETLDIDRLPAFLQPDNGGCDFPAVRAQLRASFMALAEGRVQVEAIRMQSDLFFFGETLPLRNLEPRMAAVVNRIRSQPCDCVSADDFAGQVDLSFSRFLHLFKTEVGTTFRRFRAWKRARSFLSYVNTELNLTDIALETGYPDSSHFSHTVRRYWGLTPRDIIAGSRRLSVINDGNAYPGARY